MNGRQVANPYLVEFRTARKHPDADTWEFQWSFAHRYAWAVPAPAALDAIAEFAHEGIVEIGAGTGYWASILRQMGLNVIAYDASPVDKGRNRFHRRKKCGVRVTSFTQVLRGDATMAACHPDRVLMLCWPPHDMNPTRPRRECRMSDRALASYSGDKLIYIGQRPGGVTGSRKFHEQLRKEWICVRKIRTPNFKGKATSVYLYVRALRTAALQSVA